MARKRIHPDTLYKNPELLKTVVYYDETSPTFLRRIKPNWKIDNSPAGSKTTVGYYHFVDVRDGVCSRYLNHRAIWILHNGVIPEGMVIDHIDGNKTNNNIKNLRLCTMMENNLNRVCNYNRKNGLPTAIYPCAKKQYCAILHRNKERFISERVDTVEQAVIVRDNLKRKICGEFSPV